MERISPARALHVLAADDTPLNIKLNGYEVAEKIRDTAGPNQHCEMAALTGYAFDSDVQKAQEAGFNFHFSKPIQFNLLLNRLAICNQNTK